MHEPFSCLMKDLPNPVFEEDKKNLTLEQCKRIAQLACQTIILYSLVCVCYLFIYIQHLLLVSIMHEPFSCLMKDLPNPVFEEDKKNLTLEQCKRIAQLAKERHPLMKPIINYSKEPAYDLIKALDMAGCSRKTYERLRDKVKSRQVKSAYFKPQSKIAILIANNQYEYLSKLGTPMSDCLSLASKLLDLGFIVVTLANTNSMELKTIFECICTNIPKESYVFVYYAGHGCELCNVNCILGTNCPIDNVRFEHCVTENFLLRELGKSKPELGILIMDMCRLILNSSENPLIYSQLSNVEEYKIHKNMLIAYSTQPADRAFEMHELSATCSCDTNETRQLASTDKIGQGVSQYASILTATLCAKLDVGQLLDKVHGDVEKLPKLQRPQKTQSGVTKHSLYDPAKADIHQLTEKLREKCKDYKSCSIQANINKNKVL